MNKYFDKTNPDSIEKYAQQLVGHTNINVTMKYYVNVPQDDRQQAVDLLAKNLDERIVREPEIIYLTPSKDESIAI